MQNNLMVKHSTKHHHILLFTILVGVFWIKAAALLSMPFLTIFLYKNTTISPAAIGIIVGIQPIAYCISSLFGGHLSNFLEKPTIILLSVICGMISFFGVYYAGEYLHGNSLLIAISLMNMLNGISGAFFSPVARALLSDIANSPEQNIQYLHLRYLIINIGAVVGPLIGAYAGVAGNTTAFKVTAISYAIYTIFFLFIRKHFTSNQTQVLLDEEKTKFLPSMQYLFTNSRFMGLMISLAIFSISYVQFTTTLGIIVNNSIINGTIFFSWLISFNAIVVLIIQPIIYKIIKEQNQSKVALLGFLTFVIIGVIPIFMPVTKLSLTIFVFGLTIAEILIFPTSSILISEFVTSKYRSTAYGVIEMSSLGTAIGPAIGGLIFSVGGTQFYFISQLIIGIIATLTFYLSKVKQPE